MSIVARCLLCGKKVEVKEDHSEYLKLQKKKKQEEPTFICDLCKGKVRYEAQELTKPSRPI